MKEKLNHQSMLTWVPKNLSTDTQILRLLLTIKQLKNLKIKRVYIIFFDFKQAFDNVNWDKMKTKLIQEKYPLDIIKTIEILYNNVYASFSTFKNRA